MENLFIRQCEALIETMLLCKKEQQTRELSMDEWVEENQCGYVACILGHHATMNDVAPFHKKDHCSVCNIANAFAGQLLESCSDLLGSDDLASSIFLIDRLTYAAGTRLFTHEELETLNHLNKENPSFEDVIEYLELVIYKTEQAMEKAA